MSIDLLKQKVVEKFPLNLTRKKLINKGLNVDPRSLTSIVSVQVISLPPSCTPALGEVDLLQPCHLQPG